MTALHLAGGFGKIESANVLLANGADRTIVDVSAAFQLVTYTEMCKHNALQVQFTAFAVGNGLKNGLLPF